MVAVHGVSCYVQFPESGGQPLHRMPSQNASKRDPGLAAQEDTKVNFVTQANRDPGNAKYISKCGLVAIPGGSSVLMPYIWRVTHRFSGVASTVKPSYKPVGNLPPSGLNFLISVFEDESS